MHNRSNVIYVYDGSFEWLLCCIFESYEKKEIPLDIKTENDNPVLFNIKEIITDKEKSQRVYKSLGLNVSPEARRLFTYGFLCDIPDREMLLYKYARLSFKYKSKITNMLVNDTVDRLNKAVKHLTNESHRFIEFVRFSIYGDVLVSVIEPKNFVLPLISDHFCNRFMNECFMIYDKTHRQALIYKPNSQALIIPLDDFKEPEAENTEISYRKLWKGFYDAIAIEGRYNPRCRMNHMPKWYWKNMTEMKEDEQNIEHKQLNA